MRSPGDMQTIQIDITNACDRRCSNCTRFCGNHEKPFFMDFDTFQRAVESLEGYDGVIGIMGGEPTLHPEFGYFIRYIQEKFGKYRRENRMVYPQREFIREIGRREFESHVLRKNAQGEDVFKMCGVGLWSNMGPSYYAKYEQIQDTFDVQFLNDHINPSYHQPGLFSRKDLKIPDSDWIPMRDNCWIQNEWSATITPKGCFFCEVAGALDMLFDGPGGWPIEKGWWKRSPEEFKDQLHWCEICGFALNTFVRDAEEETDDVSPTVYRMLQKRNSPKLKSGHINRVVIENGQITCESKRPAKQFSRAQPFIGAYEERFNAANSALFVHEYEEFRISDNEKFGVAFNRALKNAREWILVCTGADVDKSEVDRLVVGCVLNPGTLHLGKGVALLSKRALSLRQLGFDRIAAMDSFQDVVDGWIPGKVVDISAYEKDINLSRKSIRPGMRYALWGTGVAGSNLFDLIEKSGGTVAAVIDSDPSKEGNDFYGVPIQSPACLAQNQFDYLLLGHYSKFSDMCRMALKLGVSREKIMFPYEV